MKSVTDSSFQSDVLEAKSPVLVKFEANWCQPCKAMTPVIKDIEFDMVGKVSFVSANVESCQVSANRYVVRQIPALILFDKGEVVGTKIGPMTRQGISDWIKSLIP
jgi:thioredoxin 1